MAAPVISGLPEAPSTSDSANFDAEADAFVAALPTLRSEINAVVTWINSTLAGAAPVGAATTLLGRTWDEKVFNPNLLHNHDGMIAERNAFGGNADDTYDFDRWVVLTQTGAVTSSQLTNVANNTPFMMRMSQAQAVAQRMGRLQILESGDALPLRGQNVSFQIKVRTSVSQPIKYCILEHTGTADVVASDVVFDWTNASVTPGNFLQATDLTPRAAGTYTPAANTLETINVEGVGLGSAFNNLILFAWTGNAAAQNVTLDLAMKLERGVVSSPFSFRPYAQELILCQRYCEVIRASVANERIAIGQAHSTTVAECIIPHKVQKRANPTVTWPTPGTVKLTDSTNSATGAATALATATTSQDATAVTVTVPSGLVAGNATKLLADATDDPIIIISADL